MSKPTDRPTSPITQADIDAGRLIPRQRDASGRLLPIESTPTSRGTTGKPLGDRR